MDIAIPTIPPETKATTTNLLRFGVTSTSTHGGSFEVDYVRWTTDGAWQYRDAPKGLVLYVR